MAADIIDQLLGVQEFDQQIVQLEQELAALPGRRAEIEQGLQTFAAAVAAREEERIQAQLRVKQAELDIETQRQKMARLREQQLTLKTNREFRAMEDEISAINTVVSQLETRLLEAMDAVDDLSRQVTEGKTEQIRARGQIDRDLAAQEERGHAITETLERLRQQRNAAAKDIPAVWMSAYQRLFAGRRDRVLVPVEKSICGGCHMQLPPAVAHSSRRAGALVTCDFCGRMLYSPERMML